MSLMFVCVHVFRFWYHIYVGFTELEINALWMYLMSGLVCVMCYSGAIFSGAKLNNAHYASMCHVLFHLIGIAGNIVILYPNVYTTRNQVDAPS